MPKRKEVQSVDRLVALVRKMTRAGLGFTTIRFELIGMGHNPRNVDMALSRYYTAVEMGIYPGY